MEETTESDKDKTQVDIPVSVVKTENEIEIEEIKKPATVLEEDTENVEIDQEQDQTEFQILQLPLEEESGNKSPEPEIDPLDQDKPESHEESDIEESITTSTIQMVDEEVAQVPEVENEKPARFCRRSCLGCIDFFAHNRVYGSIIGPHPVSFWCCCKSTKSETISRVFSTASFSTRLMYILVFATMVIIATFCLFIPGPAIQFMCGSLKYEDFALCERHLGYFMTYRVFLSFNLFCSLMALILINVKSTTKCLVRSKLHQGFWLYKYGILLIFLLVCFLLIPPDISEFFIFEYLMMTLGFISFFIFSLAQLTFILDLIEISIVQFQEKGHAKSYKCLYWFLTIFFYFIDCLLIVILILCYGSSRSLSRVVCCLDSNQFNFTDKIKDSSICIQNIIFISYDLFIGLFLTIIGISSRLSNSFENNGLFQCSIVTLHTIFLTWSALENDPNFECRTLPISSVFTPQGFTHGLLTILTLLYFTLFNGPRSESAPLSRAFNKIVYRFSRQPQRIGYNYTKSLEDEENQRFYDDESETVQYSWPIFYICLVLASFTMMMSMTNFSSPKYEVFDMTYNNSTLNTYTTTTASTITNEFSNTTNIMNTTTNISNSTTIEMFGPTSVKTMNFDTSGYNYNPSFYALSIKMILSFVSILIFLWPFFLPIKWIYPEFNLRVAPAGSDK